MKKVFMMLAAILLVFVCFSTNMKAETLNSEQEEL